MTAEKTTRPVLVVEVEGRTLRFDGSHLLRIGRSIDADIVLTAASVSRNHAELRPFRTGWMLVDAGSQFGTFVEEKPIREHRVESPVRVRCGPDAVGSVFSIRLEGGSAADAPSGVEKGESADAPVPPPVAPVAPAAPPAPPADRPEGPVGGVALPAGGYAQTQVVAGRTSGGFHGASPDPSGPDLLVVAEGREYRYRHPGVVRIGRAPESEVVVEDPACSRAHGVIAAHPGGWSYTNTSPQGTFRDGRRVRTVRFEDRTELRLGHPVAGPQLTLVPILSAAAEERRIARRRHRHTAGIVAVVVAVVVLLGLAITVPVLLLNGEDDKDADGDRSSSLAPTATPTSEPTSTLDTLTQAELSHAKAATVLLSAETFDSRGRPVAYAGSGSIISPDGLILTNAHVAKPSAPGLAQYYGDQDRLRDPKYLVVSVVNGEDSPARDTYRAKVVTFDGLLDAAVVRIYARADGRRLTDDELGALNLPSMEIGDSDAARTGDDVTVLGFPGISGSRRLTVTTGVIATFIDRPDLGPRSEIDTDARIAPGNSGGAAINNDAQIIGIPSALFGDGDSPVYSGRLRAINYVQELIEQAGG